MTISKPSVASSAIQQLSCVRFQYHESETSKPFETMPFYKYDVRGILINSIGHVVWLKGNTGGIRSAWLLYDENVAADVTQLLSKPLDTGGTFEVTAKEEDPNRIMLLFTKKMVDAVGQINLPGLTIGNDTSIRLPSEKEWWERFDWKIGFWYKSFPCGKQPHYHHIRAHSVVPHQDKKGLMLCLRDYEELAVTYNGNASPTLYQATSEEEYQWENNLKELVEQQATFEEVLRNEPEWKQVGGEM